MASETFSVSAGDLVRSARSDAPLSRDEVRRVWEAIDLGMVPDEVVAAALALEEANLLGEWEDRIADLRRAVRAMSEGGREGRRMDDLRRAGTMRCPEHGAGNVGGGVARYECGCVVLGDAGREPGGAPSLGRRTGLADLRAAIGEWCDATSAADLDAELAAVEGQLERLARFVRAWDAYGAALPGDATTRVRLEQARAAVTPDDLA